MKLHKLVILLVLTGLATLSVASPARASGESPAAQAESLRTALFNAQRSLLAGDTAASEHLAAAEAVIDGEFGRSLAAADPEAAARIHAALAAMAQAVTAGDAPAFAAARAQAWTAVLAASYRIVEQAVQAGDAATAQAWLLVREFRTASRFARPNGDATVALVGFANGEVDGETVQQFLRADLYDTYQARLNEALRELALADASGFATRRAELAALAGGYFAILAPAYAEQRGEAALAAAQAAFSELLEDALAGSDIQASSTALHGALEGFRAAPLSPEEQARRAGQLLRYIYLVPLEYGRGVSNGQVTLQFEIQEAVTFHEAAVAAFEDLRDVLALIDPAATASTASTLQSMGARLLAANSGGAVAEPRLLNQQAEEVMSTLDELMPEEWKQQSVAGDFDVITSMLDQMENAVRAGDYAMAESARLEAYAVMESGPEARLTSLDPELKLRVEALFWNGDANHSGLSMLIAQQVGLQPIRTARVALNEQLRQVQTLLSVQSAPGAIATNAAVIVFREGLEAVLILASLMGSLKLQNQQYRRPLWVGTGLALLATVLTWSLARSVLLSLARYGEKLEAIVSLIAIVVLLLITNWFFHKSYWDNWLASFHGRKRRLLTGETGVWLGLISLGFTSVYREGFETVLFLQALVLDGGNQVVLAGVAIGLVLTLIIGFLTFRFQSRLPHKKMLIVTGIMIGAVLLVMVGKTTYVLQLLGWLPAHTMGFALPYWAGMWFGLYATWEGFALQCLAALIVIGSYLLAEGLKKQNRKSPSPGPA
ncbi:MAG: FTR1 family protein [Anaerolineales bacterium]|nr:MAG: FTR1 family protein [Anaerolineales bacterium]